MPSTLKRRRAFDRFGNLGYFEKFCRFLAQFKRSKSRKTIKSIFRPFRRLYLTSKYLFWILSFLKLFRWCQKNFRHFKNFFDISKIFDHILSDDFWRWSKFFSSMGRCLIFCPPQKIKQWSKFEKWWIFSGGSIRISRLLGTFWPISRLFWYFWQFRKRAKTKKML